MVVVSQNGQDSFGSEGSCLPYVSCAIRMETRATCRKVDTGIRIRKVCGVNQAVGRVVLRPRFSGMRKDHMGSCAKRLYPDMDER